MLTRRALLAFSATTAAVLMAGPKAWAQEPTAFVVNLGNAMAAVVNGPGSLEEKKRRLNLLIEESVDIDGIARFCLGRFWKDASPEQQRTFIQLFHAVLTSNIASRLGDFQGISFTPTTTTQGENEARVGTIIRRPNQQPNNVQWWVSSVAGRPKIIDVVAEGTSLRVTQRSDYYAYLSRNSIDGLLAAMRKQAGV